MNTRRALLTLPVALGLPRLTTGADKPEPGPTARALLAWAAAVGLKEGFSFDSEEIGATSYALSLYAGNVELPLGRERAEALYTRMFLKLVTLSDRPAMATQLHIVIRDGGYCDAGIVRKTAQFTQAGLAFKTELVRRPIGILCSLDFERIMRYEDGTKKAASGAEHAMMEPAVSAPATAAEWSIDRLATTLTKRFEARGAKVVLTAQTDSWLSLVVRGIQKEVIATQSYWERLQVFVLLEKLAGATRMRMILDGKYGAGLTQPSDLGYVDMEPTYTSQLNEYGNALVQALSKKAMP